MLSKIYFFLQEGAGGITDSIPKIEKESLLDIVFGYTPPDENGEGGGYSITSIIIVLLLLAMSVMAVYIFLERYFNIRRALKQERSFMVQVESMMRNGDLQGARALCDSTDNPAARMVSKGIMRVGKPVSDIKASIENVAEVEVHKLENKISVLATIAGSAPMIGFLGTVLGMMWTFMVMKDQGVEIDSLSGGIMQAMVTTVAGLIVGIIAYMAYNFLVSKMNQVIHNMESTTIEFLDILEEPGK